MLVAVVGTDRDEVEAAGSRFRDRKWVSIRLSRMGSDHSVIEFSISVDVARELASQLPKAINDAERLAATGEQEAADA